MFVGLAAFMEAVATDAIDTGAGEALFMAVF